MKHLITILLVFICTLKTTKGEIPLKQNNLYHRNYFSFYADIGSANGFTPIYTGFLVDDGSAAVYFPSGGGFSRFSTSFTHGRRLIYSITYAYQIGGLNLFFNNGDGENIRNIFTPTIRFAPVLFKKGKINIGIGANHIVSNHLTVTAKEKNETHKAKYQFDKSTGPTALIEYQENINDLIGARVGAGYSYMKYRLENFTFNDNNYSISAAPYEMHFHKAHSIELYLGFYIYL